MAAHAIFIRDHMKNLEEFATYVQNWRAPPEDNPLTPLADYGAAEIWKGELPPGLVGLQLPTVAAARVSYNNPANQDVLVHPMRAADCRIVRAEGL